MSSRFLLALVLVASACAPAPPPTLKDAFTGRFLLGGALGESVFAGGDTTAAAIARTQFNTITAENVLKWEAVHPAPDSFHFGASDAYVAFGETSGQFIVGHCLVWHSQTPGWVFQDAEGNDLTREALLARLEDHITTVVGRYRGRIGGWDVVNEALNEDGSLRDTPWRRIIGDDYLVKAFEFARAADPEAELYYNDYSLVNPPKVEGALRIVTTLQEAGIEVGGIGEQGHYTMAWPPVSRLDSAVVRLASTGVPVMITELDVDVLPFPVEDRGADLSTTARAAPELNPFVAGFPDAEQAALADRYASIFQVFVNREDLISRVTFWGVTDGGSWLNGWPIRGRTNYPLLFGRDGAPKPAFDAVVATTR